MLGKLFKLEMKQTSKFSLALIAFQLITMIIASIACLLMPMDLFRSNYEISNPFLVILLILLTFMLIASIVMSAFCPYISYLYQAYRYYKLYTHQGYLMFTLPCTKLQLFLSKLFTFLSWIVITIVSTIIGYIILLVSILYRASDGEFFRNFSSYFSQFMSVMKLVIQEAGFDIITVGILYIVLLVVAIIFTVASFYLAISIGQLFNKYKLVASIGVYFGIYTAYQIIVTIFSFIMGIFSGMIAGVSGDAVPSPVVSLIPMIVLMALLATGGIIGSYSIMKNKLNLE